MEEGHAEELTRRAEVKETLALEPQEADKLTMLLNMELRKAEGERWFGGHRVDPTLTHENAQPLNEVFKQLVGEDHDVYERVFGSTMPATKKPVRSDTIRISKEERRAVSELIDLELSPVGSRGSRSIHPDYKQVLLNLRQKFTVQNQPPAPKS